MKCLHNWDDENDPKAICKTCGAVKNPKAWEPEKDIFNAEHPYRKTAIAILEQIQDRVNKTSEIKDELWYELEDYITFAIKNASQKLTKLL